MVMLDAALDRGDALIEQAEDLVLQPLLREFRYA